MKVPLLLLTCAALAAASEGHPRKRLPLVSTDVIPSPEPGHTTEDVTDLDRPTKQHQRNHQVAFWHPPGLEGPEPSNSTKCFHIRVSRRRGRRRHQKRRKGDDDSQPTDTPVTEPEDLSDVLTVRKNRKHLIPSVFICTNRKKNRRRKGYQRRQGKNSQDAAEADDSADEDLDGKTRRRRRLSHLALRSLRREMA